MKTCRVGSVLVFAIVLTLAAPGLVAQSAAGLRPFGSYGTGNLDSVNLTDLDLHIHVPIIDNPGRGLPFTYSLDYDGLLWQPVLVNGQEVWSPPAGDWGWIAATSGNAGSYSFLDTEEQCRDRHGNIYYYDLYRYFTYTDSSGITHSFSGSTGGRPQECGGTGGSSAFTSIATDGSGYTIQVTDYANAVLTSASGETLNAEGPQDLPALGPVVDRNGNEITQSVSGSTVTYTDTVGNHIVAQTANGFIGSVNYPGPNGYPQTVTVQFQPMQISTQNLYCASGGPVGGYGPVTVELPFHFIFPNGEEYSVSYNSDGAINALTLPSGGIIQYNYSPNGPGGQDYVNCATGEWANLNRTTPQTATTPGTEWSYALVPGGVSGQMVTTITNGAQQARTVLTSMDGYETERDIYNTASGAEVRSIVTCYNGNTTNCSSSAVAAAVIRRDVFTTLGAAGSGAPTSETMTGYDAFGNETERDDYAFGSGAPGALLRRVLTTMDTSLGNVEDEPSAITIDSGAGTPTVSETAFSYDQTSLAPTSGVPNHVAVSGPRGNLTDVAEYTAAGAYLTRYFTYFDTGLVHQNFAENYNGQTTFAYGQCGSSLPTLITKPDSTTETISWNCGGQRPASITDANGQTTSFQYDDLGAGGWQWRPTTITGPDGTTSITYYGTETDSVHNFGSSTDTMIVCFDQLGRPLLRQREWGPSINDYDTVETSYDGAGRAIAVTAPEVSSRCTAPSNPVTAKSVVYDALNRPTSVTDASGGTVTYTYNGNDVLQSLGPAPTGENPKQRQLEYDALGRLSSVCEVTGAADGLACGQTAAANGYLTTYSYDPAGRQTGSVERDNSVTQTRSAAFDWLGRKTSETNPENGTTSYVYDLDSAACPGETGNDMGSLIEKSDADGSVTCFYHDSSARLIEETYSLANTLTRYFVYGSGVSVDGQPMQYAAGRLAEAFTGSPTSKQTDEGFSYATDGSLATLYEKTPNESAYSYVTNTYAQNGVITGTSSNLAGLPSFTYGLDGEGRWYSVSASSGQNPVSQTQYNAGSEPTQVWYGSGDHDNFSYDSALEDMTEFDNYVGSGAEYGSLTWNPNGTLASLHTTGTLASGTNCGYTHDDLARLQSVTCDPWTQDFTVDAFGNIAVDSAGGGATLYQANYNHATNRISDVGGSAVTYDADGNILSDPQHSYTWDANGRPVSIGDASHTVSASYDALGRMVEFGTAGAWYQLIYGPQGRLGIGENGVLQKAEIPLPGPAGGGAAVYNASGLAFYRHADWQGSGRLGSTPSQTAAFYQDYSPFGELQSGTGATDRAWAGMESAVSANLYDAELREFESVAGRWPSPDPLGQGAVDLGDPQTLNRYAYAGNEPLEMTDPSGGCFFCFGVSELGVSFGLPDLIPGFGEVIGFGQFMNAIFGGYTPPKPVTPKHAQVHEYSGVNPNGALQGEVDGIPAGVTLPQAVPFLPIPSDNCDFGVCGVLPAPWTGQGGISIGATFWNFHFSASMGIAFDLRGGFGFYVEGGAGEGAPSGASAHAGVQVGASDAKTICGLRGPFADVGATVGGSALDVFHGKSNGKSVSGGTVTFGPGAGASGSAEVTVTGVKPVTGGKCR